MEESESAPLLSRKELRKQRLMEYLAAKRKLKHANDMPFLHVNCHNQKASETSAMVVMEKENKAPPNKMKWTGSKAETLVPQFSCDPHRRRHGVSEQVKVKNGKQNAIRSLSSRVSAPTKVHQDPMLRRTYTVLSTKSNLNRVSPLKKQPTTGRQNPSKVQPSGQRFDSDQRSSLRSNRATFGPLEMASGRISTGPLVKTKTGLVPAVTQPKDAKSDVSHPAGVKRQTFTTSSDAKKGQSSRFTSISVSQKPAVVLSTRSRIESKTEFQNKSKPGLLTCKQTQLTGKSKILGGPRLTVPSRSKTVKQEEKVLTSKPVRQPVDRPVKVRSETEGKKNIRSGNADVPTISRTSIQRSSTVVKTIKQTVLSKDGMENKTSKETQINKQKTSTNIPSIDAARKRTVAPVGSQTAPQPSRSVSLVSRAATAKTPKVAGKVAPQTEVKKLTSAQEERMRKLQEWRESKGISYKRPPMPVKPAVSRAASVPQPFWVSMNVEDEAHSLIYAVDRSLADCIKLLAEGCRPDQVKQVLSRLPAVSKKFAKYWICQARLMEQEGDLDVLPMFEEAVGVVLEPVDELRSVVFDILKKKDEIQENNEKREEVSPTGETSPDCGNNPLVTPKPIRALIKGERGESSIVKYKITATPGCPTSQQKEPVRVNGQEVRFFTPVRRSVRIERASVRYPPSLLDHDVCVSSYDQLISEEAQETSEEPSGGSGSGTQMYIYRENEALGDKVSVKLVLDESL